MQVKFGKRFILLAGYFPQKSTQRKRPFFDYCGKIAKENESIPFLIMGDLNTGNSAVDKSDAGTRFYCEDGFNDLSRRHGLTDLWRHSHGEKAQEWSWRDTRSGNRVSIDHAFGNQAFIQLAAPECRYDHTPREVRYTDHSALHVVCSDRLLGLQPERRSRVS